MQKQHQMRVRVRLPQSSCSAPEFLFYDLSECRLDRSSYQYLVPIQSTLPPVSSSTPSFTIPSFSACLDRFGLVLRPSVSLPRTLRSTASPHPPVTGLHLPCRIPDNSDS